MSTIILDFLGFKYKNEENIEIHPRSAYIEIKTSSVMKKHNKSGLEIEVRALSSECVTPREMDEQMAIIIRDLEVIRKKAKKFFKK